MIRITLSDRAAIEAGIYGRKTLTELAKTIHKSPRYVSEEIKRNGTKGPERQLEHRRRCLPEPLGAGLRQGRGRHQGDLPLVKIHPFTNRIRRAEPLPPQGSGSFFVQKHGASRSKIVLRTRTAKTMKTTEKQMTSRRSG